MVHGKSTPQKNTPKKCLFLPVLITGEVVDPDNLIFDIRGEILPPLETSGVFSDGAELSGRTRTDVEMLKAVFRKVLMGRGR